MNPDLSQDEVEALLGEEACSQDAVAPRDFRRPLRLGAAQLAGLRKRINSCLPAIERALVTRSGGGLELSLYDLGETTRTAVLSALDDSEEFFMQSYSIEGEAGWLQWAPADARVAVERSLGCGSSSTTDSPLSDLECSLAGGFAMALAEGVAKELGYSATTGESYTEKRLLQASMDAVPAGDEQRLSITLVISSETFSSQLHLYLPGITSGDDADFKAEAPVALPEHLDEIEVVVSAELASLELPLQDFLDIEEGDVIALGPKHEMRARLVVDGRPAGSATWGRDADRLALCVEDIQIEPKD